jgi:hypothetical protein
MVTGDVPASVITTLPMIVLFLPRPAALRPGHATTGDKG